MKTVVVVGIGALGGPVLAKLIATNNPNLRIVGVCSSESSANYYLTNGLSINWLGTRQSPVMPAEMCFSLDVFENNSIDFIIYATKAETIPSLCPIMAKKLKKDGLLISLHNGYVLDDITKYVGNNRTAAASVVWSASLLDDKSFDVTGAGHFQLGVLSEVGPQKLLEAKKLLDPTFPVKITYNIRGTLWSKMSVNSCITTLGAVTGLTFGEQTQDTKIRALYLDIITETMKVGMAHGIQFEPLKPLLSPKLLSHLSPVPTFIKSQIIAFMGKKYKGGVSSMLQSLRRGKEPEIDSINGVISNLGKKYNIPTPCHNELIRMIKEIAEGKREINIQNISKLIKN